MIKTLHLNLKSKMLFRFVLMGFVMVFSTIAVQAQIIYENDFEEENFDGLLLRNNLPTISNLSKSGKKSARFYLEHLTKAQESNSSKRKRTEVALLHRKGNFDFGKEYWISFDYRKENWKNDNNSEIGPFQIHTQNQDETNKDCLVPGRTSAVSNSPFLTITNNGVTSFFVYGKKQWTWPVQEKEWINLTIHFVISYNNDGFVELWKDDVRLGRVDGVNSQKEDNCGLMKPPYFKMGIYKWDWQLDTPTDSNSRELYIDSFKIGKGVANPFGSTLAIESNTDNMQFEIYPNPTANKINIQFSENQNVERISIYDVLGKEVFTKKIEDSESKVTFNPNLSSGVYFLKMNSDKGEVSKKIIIK